MISILSKWYLWFILGGKIEILWFYLQKKLALKGIIECFCVNTLFLLKMKSDLHFNLCYIVCTNTFFLNSAQTFAGIQGLILGVIGHGHIEEPLSDACEWNSRRDLFKCPQGVEAAHRNIRWSKVTGTSQTNVLSKPVTAEKEPTCVHGKPVSHLCLVPQFCDYKAK